MFLKTHELKTGWLLINESRTITFLLSSFIRVFFTCLFYWFCTTFQRKWGWRKESKYFRVKSGLRKKGWRKRGWWKLWENQTGGEKVCDAIFWFFLDMAKKKMAVKKTNVITKCILLRTIVKNYPILDRYFHRNSVVFFHGHVFLFKGVIFDISHVC